MVEYVRGRLQFLSHLFSLKFDRTWDIYRRPHGNPLHKIETHLVDWNQDGTNNYEELVSKGHLEHHIALDCIYNVRDHFCKHD